MNMNGANIINFKLNNHYSSYFMKNSILDISTVLTTLVFNGYTIFEIVNKLVFPIILAAASLVLTIFLIVVQCRKMKLLSQQLNNEVIESKKKELELKQLEEEDLHHTNVN